MALLFPLQAMAFFGFFEGAKNDSLQACAGQTVYMNYMNLHEPISGHDVLNSFRKDLRRLPGIYVYGMSILQEGNDMWRLGAGLQEFFDAPMIFHDSSVKGEECAGVIAGLLRSHYAKNYNYYLRKIDISSESTLSGLGKNPQTIQIFWHKAGHSW